MAVVAKDFQRLAFIDTICNYSILTNWLLWQPVPFQINSTYRNDNLLHHNNSKYPVHVGTSLSRHISPHCANAVIPHGSSCAALIPLSSPSKPDHLPTASLFPSLSLTHTHTLPSAEFKSAGTAEFVTAATVMLMAGNNGRLGHVSISEGTS